MKFTDNAAQLAGQAALAFGWRPSDFWDATPTELMTIILAMTPSDTSPPTNEIITQLMEQFPDG